MGIQDQIKADQGIFFDSTNGFAVSAQLTPQGGSVRTVNVIMSDAIACEFRDGNQTIKYNKRTLEISAVDDVSGLTVPKLQNRDGAGDMYVIDGTTWYAIDMIREGKSSGTWAHEIVISDKRIGGTRG